MSVFKMYFKLVRAVSAGFMWFAPCDAAFSVNGWASNELLVIAAMEKAA